MTFVVGDAVMLRQHLYEPADDHSPGGYLAMKGEKLIVRELRSPVVIWQYSVSHESRTDGITFSVSGDEIEEYKP